MKQFTSKTQKIGQQGEEICGKWLKDNKYTIIERNFTVKEGEIDIICTKEDRIHFIEVKSIRLNRGFVSHETNTKVTRETLSKLYNPAQNLTKDKVRKCYRAIDQYRKKENVSCETNFQFDLYCVYIDQENKKHLIQRIENIVYQ